MILHIICGFIFCFTLSISSTEIRTNLTINVTQTSFIFNDQQIHVQWNRVSNFNGEYKIQYQNYWPLNSNDWKMKLSMNAEITLKDNIVCGSKYRIKISYSSSQSETYFDITEFSIGKYLLSPLSLKYVKYFASLTVSWTALPKTDYIIQSFSSSSCRYIQFDRKCTNPSKYLSDYFNECKPSCGRYFKSLKQSVVFDSIQLNTKYIVSIFTIHQSEVNQFCETKWTIGLSSPVTNVNVIPQSKSIQVEWNSPLKPGGLIQIYYIELTNLSDKSCELSTIVCNDCYKMENYVSNVFDIFVKKMITNTCKNKNKAYSGFYSNDNKFKHTFHDLAPFTNYRVNISAVNGNGFGNMTTKVVQTLEIKPGRCDGIHFFDRTENSMKISWKCDHPNGNVIEYQILLGNSRTPFSSQSASYMLENLEACTKYCVTVRAKNTAGYGPWSVRQCSKTQVSIPPMLLITNVKGTSDDTISIDWQLNNYKCGARYQVEKISHKNRETRYTEDSYYHWNGLSQGVVFSFRIRAIAKEDSSKSGPWSTNGSTTTILQTPDAPRNIILTQPNDFTLNMKWDPPSPPNNIVESYHLYVNSSLIATDHSSTHFTLHNINPCTQYCVNITSFNSKGNGKSVMRCLKTNPSGGEKCIDISQQFQKENMALMRRQVEALEQIAKFKDVFIQLYSSVHNLKLKGVSDNN